MSFLKSLGRKVKIRGDAKIGTVEKILSKLLGIAELKLTNKNGRNTRGDKLLKNFRKDWK